MSAGPSAQRAFSSRQFRSGRGSIARRKRAIGLRTDIKCTDSLVHAYDTAHGADKAIIRKWLDCYIEWFCKQPGTMLEEGLVNEYSRLVQININDCADKREMLRRILFSLMQRVGSRDYCATSVVCSLDMALNIIDPSDLVRDTAKLIDLANVLMETLDPAKTSFNRETFASHGPTLFLLHKVIDLLTKLQHDSTSNAPMPPVYQNFVNKLTKIEKCQTYYPFLYHARLIRMSILGMRKQNANTVMVDVGRRMFYLTRGGLFAIQGLRNLAKLEFDVGAVQSACKDIKRATSDGPCSCEITYLRKIYKASMETLSCQSFQPFEAVYREIKNRWCFWLNLRLLRFWVIDHLRLLFIKAPVQSIQDKAGDLLLHLLNPESDVRWNRDAVLFEAILDALSESCAAGVCSDDFKDRVKQMCSAFPDTFGDRVKHWCASHTLDEKLATPVVSASDSNVLFGIIREKFGYAPTFIRFFSSVPVPIVPVFMRPRTAHTKCRKRIFHVSR